MRAHPPAPGQAAVRDAPAVHETLFPHRLHGPGPVRRGAAAVQHQPPAQRDSVRDGPALPLVPHQLPGCAADPRGAAGEAPVLEVHPGAVPALRRPGQGVQQVPTDRRGGRGCRPGAAGAQWGCGEPEESRAPQGAAGQLPQSHADALRGALSVGEHLTPWTTPPARRLLLTLEMLFALLPAPTQPPGVLGVGGIPKEGVKRHTRDPPPLGPNTPTPKDHWTVHRHGAGPIRNARRHLHW